MRTTMIVVATLGLAACASTPPMESALAPLAGQPVQLVLDQIGPPTSQTLAGADSVYEWRRSKTVTGTTFRAGYIPPGESSGSFAAMTALPYSCYLRIVADSQGRIKDAQFSEETGGCGESARNLRQLALADPH